MPRFAANLSMLFTEHPFLERFDRAGAAGFAGVEFLFPYAEDIPAVRDALRRNGLEQVLFNLPAGDFAAGERGFANDPARRGEFRVGVGRALEIADTLGCRRLNCLVGLALPGVPEADQWATAAENLAFAASEAEGAGVRVVVEPLNVYDAPGFLLPTTERALALLDAAAHPNLAVQYDVYHAQRGEGNLVATIRRHLDRVGHVQAADSPDRHEPGTGEINYPFVFRALDEAGYGGWVGLEYRPAAGTEASLGWLRDHGFLARAEPSA
ncbi:MAG: Hydroxypyruvate isomerase [uncultured Thermomicrobiales bacterium]|uniref:Hydroxypyruvate isomerase n=1 Tax=uncultured Thermomicrobiales bacterium TaxID=1645740 RepID=A0A6J4VEX3_9BACT|nr:MAG: Hydroxypyruvate isomerase [uncultured Thermomicrobiales bacterium]